MRALYVNFLDVCSRKYHAGALLITVFITAMGAFFSIWIPNFSQEINCLKDLQLNLTCATCETCLVNDTCAEIYDCKNISIHRKCRERGWALPDTIPKKCEDKNEFSGYIKKEVRNQFHTLSKGFKTRLDSKDENVLEGVEEAYFDPSRFIFHWFPHCWNRGPTNGWTNLTDYEKYASTYTISTGPVGSCEKDTYFIIPDTGLYNIYGKITFACERADHEQKRVHMDVAMIGNVKNEMATTLMSEEDENTCMLEGDLVTLYQSGLFRMMKGNRIFLRYKTPQGVRLSSKTGSPFRSSFGAYRVGLS